MTDQPDSEATLLQQIEGDLGKPQAQAADAPVTPPVQEQQQQQQEEVVPPKEEPAVDPTQAKAAEVIPPVVEEESGPPKRIRIEGLSETDRLKLSAATSLAKAEGISFDEAYSRLAKPPEPEKQAEAVPDPAETINTRLSEVQAILDKAAQEGSYITPEILAAFDEKADLKAQLEKLETQKAIFQEQQAQAAVQDFEAKWDASAARAEEKWADAKNPESALTKAVLAEMEQIQADKKHDLYGVATLPELLFAKHAANLGIAPVVKQVAQQQQQQQPRLLPKSGAASMTPAPVVNPATQQAELQSRFKQAAESGDADELARLAEEELTGGKTLPKHSMLTFG